MKDATETTIIDAFLLGYLSHFRVPQVITTDQEAQFSSVICFLDFLQFVRCQRHRNTNYHH